MAVRHTESIAEDVERVLGVVLPAIDLVDVRVVTGGVLRVLIDHPTASITSAAPSRTRTRGLPRALLARGLVPRYSAPAHEARALRTFFAAARSMYACTLRSRAVAVSAASCSRATGSAS